MRRSEGRGDDVGERDSGRGGGAARWTMNAETSGAYGEAASRGRRGGRGGRGWGRAGGERGAIEVGGLEEADARGQTYERATARAERHVREE